MTYILAQKHNPQFLINFFCHLNNSLQLNLKKGHTFKSYDHLSRQLFALYQIFFLFQHTLHF